MEMNPFREVWAYAIRYTMSGTNLEYGAMPQYCYGGTLSAMALRYLLRDVRIATGLRYLVYAVCGTELAYGPTRSGVQYGASV
eukprot:3941968-Rhodomonas_salina.5